MEILQLRKEPGSELRSFVDETQRIMCGLSNLRLSVDISDYWPVFILPERPNSETYKL